jgi:hypothetical protein
VKEEEVVVVEEEEEEDEQQLSQFLYQLEMMFACFNKLTATAKNIQNLCLKKRTKQKNIIYTLK